MMIGELEYDDLMYNTDQTIAFSNDGNHSLNITGNVESTIQPQFYPFSAYFLMLLFIILFSIIIMNLLFGLAVSDVQVRVPNLPCNLRKSFFIYSNVFKALVDKK